MLLTTFRRDGRAVATPVWVMRDGDALAVWTNADSGKVKRIRNDGRVTVVPCTMRGRPRGRAVPAVAEIPGPEQTAHFAELMQRKYGVQARLALLGSRLRAGGSNTVGLRVRLTD